MASKIEFFGAKSDRFGFEMNQFSESQGGLVVSIVSEAQGAKFFSKVGIWLPIFLVIVEHFPAPMELVQLYDESRLSCSSSIEKPRNSYERTSQRSIIKF